MNIKRIEEKLYEVARMMNMEDEGMDFTMAWGKTFGGKGKIFCFFLDFPKERQRKWEWTGNNFPKC